MKRRTSLVASFIALALLPGCFCVSWREYESAGPNPERGSFEDDFSPQISPTRSGLSVFIQNSGPPYSLRTEYQRERHFLGYSIDEAELTWADGTRETLATSSEDQRASAIKTTGYQGKTVYRAKLDLPRTFRHVPAEGTEVILRMRVTVRDVSGKQVHHLEKKFRFTHQKGCHAITRDALMGA